MLLLRQLPRLGIGLGVRFIALGLGLGLEDSIQIVGNSESVERAFAKTASQVRNRIRVRC
jgi:hypothetical protein